MTASHADLDRRREAFLAGLRRDLALLGVPAAEIERRDARGLVERAAGLASRKRRALADLMSPQGEQGSRMPTRRRARRTGPVRLPDDAR